MFSDYRLWSGLHFTLICNFDFTFCTGLQTVDVYKRNLFKHVLMIFYFGGGFYTFFLRGGGVGSRKISYTHIKNDQKFDNSIGVRMVQTP